MDSTIGRLVSIVHFFPFHRLLDFKPTLSICVIHRLFLIIRKGLTWVRKCVQYNGSNDRKCFLSTKILYSFAFRVR